LAFTYEICCVTEICNTGELCNSFEIPSELTWWYSSNCVCPNHSMKDSQSILLPNPFGNSGPIYFVCDHMLRGIVCDDTRSVSNVCAISSVLKSQRKEITRMLGITALEVFLSWRNKCLDVLSAGDMFVLEKNISLLR